MATDGWQDQQAQAPSLDAVIFGGGAAGLWLLDDVTRRGRRAVVLEAGELGSGQTIASQGIIHGGLKYTLTGLFTSSAQAIRDMPLIWRRRLAGERTDGEGGPNLSHTRLRAAYCHLWRTDTVRSRLGMIGARAGLRIAPIALERDARPPVLAECPGTVARLDEQVIEPSSFLDDLAGQHRARLLKIDLEHGVELVRAGADGIGFDMVRLIDPDSGRSLDLRARSVVFLAGAGNARLREMAGLSPAVMQRRPLHMVMLRGELPLLNGHCVDGAATRLTITTTRDSAGRAVWQVGGRVSETGVDMDRAALIAHARAELTAALPGFAAIDPAKIEWSTYRVDRAEGDAGAGSGARPDDVCLLEEGNVITGWPTKLALVPRLSGLIAAKIGAADAGADAVSGGGDAGMGTLAGWPRPVVALPPWECEASWIGSE